MPWPVSLMGRLRRPREKGSVSGATPPHTRTITALYVRTTQPRWGKKQEPQWDPSLDQLEIQGHPPVQTSRVYRPPPPPHPLPCPMTYSCLLSPEQSGGEKAFFLGSSFPLLSRRRHETSSMNTRHSLLTSSSSSSSLSCLFSRQDLLQPPLQLGGHAGDHPALCRLPRGCPGPAGRCCLLPRGVRRGSLAPQGRDRKAGQGGSRWLGGGISLAFHCVCVCVCLTVVRYI